MPTFPGPNIDPDRLEDLEWLATCFVHFNGVDIPLEVEPEEESGKPSPVQQKAIYLALTLPPDVLEKAAPAVVQNYDVYREALGDEELAPLQAPVDVWKRVHPTSIRIEPHDGFPLPTFFVQAECDWDPEHGLTVRFRNGQADESNQQGEIGMRN